MERNNLTIELLETAGFKSAFRAMREPMRGRNDFRTYTEEQDVQLAERLIASGDDHAKHMRLALAWFEIKAPRYFWSEFDTYRIGVEKVSRSTMHRLMQNGLKCSEDCVPWSDGLTPKTYQAAEDEINDLARLWKDEKSAKKRNEYLRKAKSVLPEGYLQTRVVCISYQTLRRIYLQRRNHRLKEWQTFCNFVETLPYSELITLNKYLNKYKEKENRHDY